MPNEPFYLIVIEFKDVHWEFFNPFKRNICDYYGITESIGKVDWGYKYHLHIKLSDEVYFHISYQPFHEPKSYKHTLRIETHPDYLPEFKHLLDTLYQNAGSIWFIRRDVAFDIPSPISFPQSIRRQRPERVLLRKRSR